MCTICTMQQETPRYSNFITIKSMETSEQICQIVDIYMYKQL
eukprot:SAG31_NODE_3405_length_4311_cov_2.512821_4_plen_42_part_00